MWSWHSNWLVVTVTVNVCYQVKIQVILYINIQDCEPKIKVYFWLLISFNTQLDFEGTICKTPESAVKYMFFPYSVMTGVHTKIDGEKKLLIGVQVVKIFSKGVCVCVCV